MVDKKGKKDKSDKGVSLDRPEVESFQEDIRQEEACDELEMIIRDLPEGKQDQIKRSVSIIARQASMFQGPIPPPEYFAQYDKVLPGTAERIVVMAEKEQAHRHERDDILDYLQVRGLWLGTFIIILLVGLAAFALYYGFSGPAITIVLAMSALATIYVLRQRPHHEKKE